MGGSGVVLGLVAAIGLAAGCAGTTALSKKRVVVLELEKAGAPAVERAVTDLVAADYELIPAEDYWLLAARIRAESMEAGDVARVAEYADADAVVTAKLVPAGGKRATLEVSLREVAGGNVVARYEIPVRAGAVTKRGQRKLAARVRPELAELTGLAWQRAARERAAAGQGATDAPASGRTGQAAASSSREVERPVKRRPTAKQRRAAKAKQKRATKARRIAKQKRSAKSRRIAKQKRSAKARRVAKQKRSAKARRLAKQERAAKARRVAKQKRAAKARRVAKQKRAAKARRVAKQKRTAKPRRVAQREQPAKARRTASRERSAAKPRKDRRVAARSVTPRAERASASKGRASAIEAVDDDPTPPPPVQYDDSGQALDDEVPAALE